jgi:DNA end-binding protein Ku
VEDEELDKIRIASTHTIDIGSFVPRVEIDDRYLNAPYYIAPDGKVGEDRGRSRGMVRETVLEIAND